MKDAPKGRESELIWFAYGLAIVAIAAAIISAVQIYQAPAVERVSVVAHANGFNVTLAVARGEIRGVFLTYGPAYKLTERCAIVGECNGMRSDEVKAVEGMFVTCAFPAKLVRGLEYEYVLYVIYDGKHYAVARGVTVPK